MGKLTRSAILVAVLTGFGLGACGGGGTTPAARPAHAPADDTAWFSHPAPDGKRVLVGVVRAPGAGTTQPPSVLLVPGTDGLNTDYDVFAHQLAATGLDVAIGCWFGDAPKVPASPLIGCASGPEFKGVSDPAVPDLDVLVQAAKDALHTDRLVVVGFSRGGGIAMLRAGHGADEPVVSVAGMLEGTTNLGTAWGEVNVVGRAADIHVPVLLLHGEDDTAVPVQQAKDMEAALRAHGDPVSAKYYPGQGHALAGDPATRRDLIAQIAAFTCAQLGCSRS